MMRCIFGNLDYEYQLLNQGHALPPAIKQRLSASASILRVFGGDYLCTITPFDSSRIPESNQIPHPKFITAEELHPEWECLCWGVLDEMPRSSKPPQRFESVIQNAWACPQANYSASKSANDKLLCHEFQRRYHQTLEGSQTISSNADLDQVDFPENWVVKPRFGVAGRGRIVGNAKPSREEKSRIAKSLAQHEQLVLEPWVSRVLDLGVTGFLDTQGVYGLKIHQLKVNAMGGFVGIDCNDNLIDEETKNALLKASEEVGSHLQALKYQGPFGFDSFIYRSRGHEHRLHAVNEINARLTYGHVAQAYAERMKRKVTLMFGKQLAPEGLPILKPDANSKVCAWLT